MKTPSTLASLIISVISVFLASCATVDPRPQSDFLSDPEPLTQEDSLYPLAEPELSPGQAAEDPLKPGTQPGSGNGNQSLALPREVEQPLVPNNMPNFHSQTLTEPVVVLDPRDEALQAEVQTQKETRSEPEADQPQIQTPDEPVASAQNEPEPTPPAEVQETQANLVLNLDPKGAGDIWEVVLEGSSWVFLPQGDSNSAFLYRNQEAKSSVFGFRFEVPGEYQLLFTAQNFETGTEDRLEYLVSILDPMELHSQGSDPVVEAQADSDPIQADPSTPPNGPEIPEPFDRDPVPVASIEQLQVLAQSNPLAGARGALALYQQLYEFPIYDSTLWDLAQSLESMGRDGLQWAAELYSIIVNETPLSPYFYGSRNRLNSLRRTQRIEPRLVPFQP